jgi:predicted RNA-binding protein YlxR (DUF448 family)
LPKRALIRIVRTPEGVQIDLTGKMAGRGAYLHDQRSCWEKGLKGALANALRVGLAPEEQAALLAFANNLPVAQTLDASSSEASRSQEI